MLDSQVAIHVSAHPISKNIVNLTVNVNIRLLELEWLEWGARRRRGFSSAAAARHQGWSKRGDTQIWECPFPFDFESVCVYLV